MINTKDLIENEKNDILVDKKNLAIEIISSIDNELEIDMINEFLEIYKNK